MAEKRIQVAKCAILNHYASSTVSKMIGLVGVHCLSAIFKKKSRYFKIALSLFFNN